MRKTQKKWGFSRETGTQWYLTPLSTCEPLCRFIAENAALFDDYEPVVQVGVLYDNRACLDNHWEVRDICRALHDANVPCGLAVAGDEWLQRRLTPDQSARFELVVIPEHSNATGEQAALLDRRREQGEAVAWTGVDHVRSRARPLITLTGTEKVWTLFRKKPSQPDGPTMIHLLNQDYDAEEDAMRMKAGFQVSIDGSLTDGCTD